MRKDRIRRRGGLFFSLDQDEFGEEGPSGALEAALQKEEWRINKRTGDKRYGTKPVTNQPYKGDNKPYR